MRADNKTKVSKAILEMFEQGFLKTFYKYDCLKCLFFRERFKLQT